MKALGVLLALLGQTDGARTIDVEFMPAGHPQIAVWVEDAEGGHVSTVMVTRLTGTFGLGNRPGRPDLGGGLMWPYGRRENALPIWAHRRGVEYPRLVFQDCREGALGWHEAHSSAEPFYCRPTSSAEIDAVTCPTAAFNSDKGIPLDELPADHPSEHCQQLFEMYPMHSYYPPRNDLAARDPVKDWSGVMSLSSMNELDAVSKATPAAGAVYRVSAVLPEDVPDGEYAVWVEVNAERDFNDDHSYAYYIDSMLRDYGVAYVGQPSVVWRLPFTVSSSAAEVVAHAHTGYGAPLGEDGDVRPADGTISTDDGTGEGRLLPLDDDGRPYRIKLRFEPDVQCANVSAVRNIRLVGSDWESVQLAIDVDAGLADAVNGFRLKYLEGANAIRDAEDFGRAIEGPELALEPSVDGEQQVRIALPWPATTYTLAISTQNRCGQESPFEPMVVRTDDREFTTVDACFIATAAYGTDYTEEVRALRQYRDEALMHNWAGRELVNVYYGVSPPIAAQLRDRPWARWMIRQLLRPVVWQVQR